MKAKPYPKLRPENLICAQLILLHIPLIFCKPQGPHGSILQTQQNLISSVSQDLNAMAVFGENGRQEPANSALPFNNAIDSRDVSVSRDNYKTDVHPLRHKDDIEKDLNDVGAVPSDFAPEVGDNSLIRDSGVFLSHDVIDDGLLQHRADPEPQVVVESNQVAMAIDKVSQEQQNRNSNRKRHQRSSQDMQKGSHRRRRKRRRQRRLLLKERKRKSRKHLNNPSDHFPLKSDDPGQVIFKGGEVKQDFCRIVPFNQTITAGRCRPKVVRNNFCYGQCNSFYIPQTERTSNQVAFKSCSKCKFHRHKLVNVTLNCPGKQSLKVRTIIKVLSCRCTAIEIMEDDTLLKHFRKDQKLNGV